MYSNVTTSTRINILQCTYVHLSSVSFETTSSRPAVEYTFYITFSNGLLTNNSTRMSSLRVCPIRNSIAPYPRDMYRCDTSALSQVTTITNPWVFHLYSALSMCCNVTSNREHAYLVSLFKTYMSDITYLEFFFFVHTHPSRI